MVEKLVTVRVPEDLHEKAKKKAKEKDVTVSQVVRRALREFTKDDDSPEDGRVRRSRDDWA
jgi:predicted HicB family RNase H-like nuclease